MTAAEIVLAWLAVLLAGSTLTFGLLWGRRRTSAPPPAVDPDATVEIRQPTSVMLHPDTRTLPDTDAAQIAATVGRVVDAYASYLAALRADLDVDVLTRLNAAMYADLLGSLTPEQLARAVITGLHPLAVERADALLDVPGDLHHLS